jgi:CheY-like chemotaxis protein
MMHYSWYARIEPPAAAPEVSVDRGFAGTDSPVFLPGSPAQTAGPSPSADCARESEGSGGIILVVEDEEMLLLAVSKMLRKKGYSVLGATDGTSAVELLHEHKGKIGLVLLDVTLPGLSSREVFDEARRVTPGIRIVLTSAYGQGVIDSSFAGTTVDHFLRKPYRLAALIEVLRNVLPVSCFLAWASSACAAGDAWCSLL